MGLAVDGPRLALGARKEVWFLRNAPDIAPRIEPAGVHDACFLPRASHVTGDIGIHGTDDPAPPDGAEWHLTFGPTTVDVIAAGDVVSPVRDPDSTRPEAPERSARSFAAAATSNGASGVACLTRKSASTSTRLPSCER